MSECLTWLPSKTYAHRSCSFLTPSSYYRNKQSPFAESHCWKIVLRDSLAPSREVSSASGRGKGQLYSIHSPRAALIEHGIAQQRFAGAGSRHANEPPPDITKSKIPRRRLSTTCFRLSVYHQSVLPRFPLNRMQWVSATQIKTGIKTIETQAGR